MNANNSVILVGNLGKDVEIREFNNGNKKGTVSLATSSVYKDKNGEYVKNTQWHSLVAWGKTAERMEKFLEKGSKIIVVGELNQESYQNKEGKTVYATNVKVSRFDNLTPKKEELPF